MYSGGFAPTQEAAAEVVANRFDATQGRSQGMVVNAVTKSGTNRFSGSAYHFLRNDALNVEGAMAHVMADLYASIAAVRLIDGACSVGVWVSSENCAALPSLDARYSDSRPRENRCGFSRSH